MSDHARYSPSGYSGWSACSGWESDPVGSEYADEGTLAHSVAAAHLTRGDFPVDPRFDAEMADYVKVYTDHIDRAAQGGQLLVEQRLPIGWMTGEEGAAGTADAIILRDGELLVADLKYGRGVRVDAEGNGQLRMYGAAALAEYDFLGDIQTVRMVIVQPRLDHISEEALTADELRAWAAAVKPATAMQPGDKQCRWCMHKADCPALNAEVHELFDRAGVPEKAGADLLAAAMQHADLIEAWLKAVRAETERRLLAGTQVPGFKLVEGRRGNRAWRDKEDAEAQLKAFKLKVEQMYDFSLISPASAEKLAKAGAIGPRQWPKVEALITQTQGKPSVAPASDKRPAWTPVVAADEFAGVDLEPIV